MMDDLKKQLNHNVHNALRDFNNSESLSNVRLMYKSNFDKILHLINLRNSRTVIEDIICIDNSNNTAIMDNFLLIMEVNRGIREGKILQKNIL